MTIAELSLKRPVTVIMAFVSMTVIGLIAAFRLPLESLPDIQVPFIAVNLPYQGSTPAEVERTAGCGAAVLVRQECRARR